MNFMINALEVEKARIGFKIKKNKYEVYYKYLGQISDKEQYNLFAKTYNKIKTEIENQTKKIL